MGHNTQEENEIKTSYASFLHKVKHKARHSVKTFKENWTWEDWVFVGVVMLFLLFYAPTILSFQQLPSPIHGGDYYNHFGYLNHLYQGGSVFDSGQMLGVEPWTPWLYHVIVILFAKVTTLSVLHANLYLAFLLLPLSALSMYLLGQLLFKNKLIALMPAIMILYAQPIFKYTPFAFYILVPFFFYFFIKFLKEMTYKNAIKAGLIYGAIGITHSPVFIAISFYATAFGILSIIKHIKFTGKKPSFDQAGIKKSIMMFGTVALVGIPIAMLYWYSPLFIYHGHVQNPIHESGFFDVTTLGGQLDYLVMQTKEAFFKFSSPFKIFLSLSTITGFLMLVFMKNKSFEDKVIMTSLIISVIGYCHLLITEPLFGTHVFPNYFYETLTYTWTMITATFGVYAVYHLLLSRLNAKLKHYVPMLLLFLVLVFLVFIGYANAQAFKNDRWTQVGLMPLSSEYAQTRDWVLQNTDLYDVFISTNENSFALNALTGRKILTNRITHSSSYVNMDQRMMDGAIILHGNNSELRKQLVEKYHVKYLYWNINWFQMEFIFDQQGRPVDIFDPYMVSDTPENRKYLSDNGVTFNPLRTWKDPAFKIEKAPMYNMLVIIPQFNLEMPWSLQLNQSLVLEKEFYDSGAVRARIFRIDLP